MTPWKTENQRKGKRHKAKADDEGDAPEEERRRKEMFSRSVQAHRLKATRRSDAASNNSTCKRQQHELQQSHLL
jgi:hypothetical protein